MGLCERSDHDFDIYEIVAQRAKLVSLSLSMRFEADPLDTPQQPRPALARWLFERGLKFKDAAKPLGVTPQAVGRYLRPFGDATRQVPGLDVMERIVAWTGGKVTPADFYPPSLNASRRSESCAPAADGADWEDILDQRAAELRAFREPSAGGEQSPRQREAEAPSIETVSRVAPCSSRDSGPQPPGDTAPIERGPDHG